MNRRLQAGCAIAAVSLLPFFLMACGSSGTYSPAATVTPATGCQIGGGSLANTPWPKVHNNNENRGLSTSQGATTGVQKWAVSGAGSTVGTGQGSPSIGADGTVYVTANSLLVALDPTSGARKWASDIGALRAPPVVASDGTLYVPGANSSGGALYAINGTTGQTVCTFNPSGGGSIGASPVLGQDKTVYLVTTSGKVYALDGSNFVEKWNVQLSPGNQIGVAADLALGSDGTLYATASDGKLYALNGTTGATRWEFSMGAASSTALNSPVVGTNGLVYVGSWGDGKVYAINATTGTKAWEFSTGGFIQSSASIGADGTVYISSWATTLGDGGPLFALDGTTGAKKWQLDPATLSGTPYETLFTPIVASDGTVYVVAVVGDRSGRLYAVSGQTGTVKWTFSIPETNVSSTPMVQHQIPAIGADGTIYLGTKDLFYAIH